MIDRFLAALQDARLLLSDHELAAFSEAQSILHDEDIADALWLLDQMSTASNLANSVDSSIIADESNDSDGEQDQASLVTDSGEFEDGGVAPPPIPAFFDNANKQSRDSDEEETQLEDSDSGLPLQVQAAPALPNAREISRALKPLMRKAPSRTQQMLDEQATVDRIAEEEIWLPVLKPAPERWFDLELVIESSPFSFVWESTLIEFQRLLERQGAFRHIRVWLVEVLETGEPKLVPYVLGGAPAQFLSGVAEAAILGRSPKELIDASGRALVLYVSDCRSELWRQGKIHSWLELWSQQEPTTVVQLLPERLWDDTELDAGFKVQVSAFTPGVANPKFQIHNAPTRRRSATQTNTLTLPIVTLTANALKQWARVVTAAGQQRLPARLFDLDWVQDNERISTTDWDVIEPQTPAARLELFSATASPQAQRLARLMSVVPVELPVVHLIQQTFFKATADPVHVAEVYDSCLLQRIDAFQTPEGVRYDFIEGMRELLTPINTIDETLDVLDALSQEIARTLGFEISSFTALLLPSVDWDEEQKAKVLPFAQIATDVLHRLGGQYAELAQRVEQDAQAYHNWVKPPDSNNDELDQIDEIELPEFKTLEFETAQLVLDVTEEPEPDDNLPVLQTAEVEVVTIETLREPPPQPEIEFGWFIFDVATLERGEGFLRRWTIQTQQRQAQRHIERLGNRVTLMMVVILGETFVMGSPSDEPERLDNEGPQHDVLVNSFLMSRYPITQQQWRVVAAMPQQDRELNPDPSRFKGNRRPVETVSWYDAQEFCARLSAYTGRNYGLPTEAEWEYACRAGTTTPFHFGETISPEVANYSSNVNYNDGPNGQYPKQTTSVDEYKYANTFGLCDMHGNVLEWCEDLYHNSYEGAPTDGSAWIDEEAEENAYRVLRGGSWHYGPRDCRSAYRSLYYPRDPNLTFGFRVVCRLPIPLP